MNDAHKQPLAEASNNAKTEATPKLKRQPTHHMDARERENGKLLDPLIVDHAAGDRPARLHPIAKFAVARSTTQVFLGELHEEENDQLSDQAHAEKVVDFLLNPRGRKRMCSWEQDVRAGRSILRVPAAMDDNFRQALLFLSNKVIPVFQAEARMLTGAVYASLFIACSFFTDALAPTVKSPVHVFGDIHGNMEDLAWLGSKIWPLGPQSSAGCFLFLGDYVDRGPNQLEVSVVILIFSLQNHCIQPVMLHRITASSSHHRFFIASDFSPTNIISFFRWQLICSRSN
jgi:hypothetical protein